MNSPFMEANNGEPGFTEIAAPDGVEEGGLNPLTIRPSTINQQAVGNLITSSAVALGQAAFATQQLPTMTTTQVNFTLADNAGRTISPNPDVAVYTNVTNPNQISAANQWPNAAYGMSNLPWQQYQNFGLTDNVNAVTSVSIRNNNAFAVNVVIAVRWRIITNSSATFQQGSVS